MQSRQVVVQTADPPCALEKRYFRPYQKSNEDKYSYIKGCGNHHSSTRTPSNAPALYCWTKDFTGRQSSMRCTRVADRHTGNLPVLFGTRSTDCGGVGVREHGLSCCVPREFLVLPELGPCRCRSPFFWMSRVPTEAQCSMLSLTGLDSRQGNSCIQGIRKMIPDRLQSGSLRGWI